MNKKINIVYVFLYMIVSSCMEDSNVKSSKDVEIMKEEKSFFIKDSRNIRHEIFKVEAFEFEKMKLDGKLIFCDQVYQLHGLNAFALADNKVIVQESDKFALYPSLEVLMDVLKGYKGPYSRELLEGKNPYHNEFPDKVDELITQMFKKFDLNPKELDKNELLSRLDSIVVKNRDTAFLDSHIMNFIALIGKYIIEDFKGKWEMVLADDKTTWTPSLVVKNQKVYFVSYIIEDFLNPKVQNPVTEVYETVKDIIKMNIAS